MKRPRTPALVHDLREVSGAFREVRRSRKSWLASGFALKASSISFRDDRMSRRASGCEKQVVALGFDEEPDEVQRIFWKTSGCLTFNRPLSNRKAVVAASFARELQGSTP